ncbi:uncharacterized protein [Diadema antillarum]|uniref:uncharacterized protein n=1 Tax=Diadema antillarum TaxID=105358 RepID=UPI003A8C45E2
MNAIHYSGRPIHRGGQQISATGQNFDPTVAALVSSMRQDLVVPESSSTPIPNGYQSYSPGSTQMDIYTPITPPPEFRGGISPVPSGGYQGPANSYDYRQESVKVDHPRQRNGRTSPLVYGRGFMISGTPSPRSPRESGQQSAHYYAHQQQSPHKHVHENNQGEPVLNNNHGYSRPHDQSDYLHGKHAGSVRAPQNGYVGSAGFSHGSHHPVTTYHEEIQFSTSGTPDGGAVTPAQLCHAAVTQNGVGAPSPRDGGAIQPKPPSSMKPRGSRTRRSLRRAADMLLNRSRQSLSDTEGKGSRNPTPKPTPPQPSPQTAYPSEDVPTSSEERAPSVRERLQKNRARMGELLRSPSLSRWKKGSKENSGENSGSRKSPFQSGSSQPARRQYRSAENLHTPSYTSYESPDALLDSRTDHSYADSSDGMSSRSIDSTPADYHQGRRYSSDHTHQRTRSRDRGNHRGYHTADSDTDSSYSRHDGTNEDSQSRHNSKRPLPSSFRLLSKGNREGPMRTTPKGPSGPLKADHSIQPFTKEKRSPDNSPRDLWAEQGARPKQYSSTDSLETEQVTHIVFQDTPIRSEPDERTSTSRPTTPSALRKSSRPPSPSRSVRFDDDTDGSYDSDRRERRPHSWQGSGSRRSESPSGGVRNSLHNGRHPEQEEMPLYATVDKTRKSRKSQDQTDGRRSRHDVWTNGVEKEDPYSTIKDSGYSNSSRRTKSESDYEEIRFRSEDETRSVPGNRHGEVHGDQRHGSGDSRKRSSSKDSRTSRPPSPSYNQPPYATVDRSASRQAGGPDSSATQRGGPGRGRTQSRESLNSFGNPCVTEVDNSIEHLSSSRLDDFPFASDYDSYKKLSGSQLSIMSRSSLSEKVEKTKKKLRRALSLDKLSSPSNKDSYSVEKPKLKKSPSLRSLTGLLKKKDKDSDSGFSDGFYGKRRSASVLGLETAPLSPTSLKDGYIRPQRTTEETDVTLPTHGRKIGRLLAVKPDGTQVIQLVKPPNGPFGFYIAKGTSSHGDGIFVTRLGDGHPAKILAGLLHVGDEILEINGQDLRRKKLDDVYDLMMDNDVLALRVRPLASREEFGS